MWQDWVNGFLGVWLVLLAFLGVSSSAALMATGLVIAVLGFWGVIRERASERDFLYRNNFGLYTE